MILSFTILRKHRWRFDAIGKFCLLATLSALLLKIDPLPGQTLGSSQLIEDARGRGVDASLLLQHAIAQLAGYSTISANVRQRINLYGRGLVGSGTYRQLNTETDMLFRTELKVPVRETLTSLLQVCDGRFLWTYRLLPTEDAQQGPEATLTRVDLGVARQQYVSSGGNDPVPYFALGGLPGLLDQTSRLFDFSSSDRSFLYGVPVWILTGTWKPQVSEAFTNLEGSSDTVKENDPTTRRRHLPDSVTLALGVDDLFPYRIEYRRRRTNPEGSSIIVSGGQSRSIMTLELFEVQTDVAIDPQVFFFQPSSVPVNDATERFMRNRRDLPN